MGTRARLERASRQIRALLNSSALVLIGLLLGLTIGDGRRASGPVRTGRWTRTDGTPAPSEFSFVVMMRDPASEHARAIRNRIVVIDRVSWDGDAPTRLGVVRVPRGWRHTRACAVGADQVRAVGSLDDRGS